MIVRAQRHKLSANEFERLVGIGFLGRGSDLDLKVIVGLDYEVEAMRFWRGELWYYIYIEPIRDYPYQVPAFLFSIVNGSIPTSWTVQEEQSEGAEVLWGNPGWLDAYYDKVGR